MERSVTSARHRCSVAVPLVFALSACGESEPPAPSPGEQIVKATCKACHASGLNGAPIIGNTKMWAKRLPQGVPVLVQHATEGYGLMPAKGGNVDLTDEQIELAVKYMLDQLNE